MTGKPRRLLWMDPFFLAARPTTQSLFQALPHLQKLGWKLELWCLDGDDLGPEVEVVHLPRARWLKLLEPHWFWLVAWVRLFWQRLCGRETGVVHISGPDLFGADVVSVHFHNITWIGIQAKEPSPRIRDKIRALHTMVGVVQEFLVYTFSQWKVALPVSEGLASRLLDQGISPKRISVLPNILDSGRFHPAVRPQFRSAMRQEQHLAEKDFVFLFVSTGHYHRKGLWHAVKAVAACRAKAREEEGLNLRLMVVGTSERARPSISAVLDRESPGWREWVSLMPPAPDVERWYAAADAFLFPSRYETFSLVALEAAACGLPLLVTPYDGHEMYLKDGINGVLLPWDTGAMAERIARFIQEDRHQMQPGPAAFLGPVEYAAHLDAVYRQIVSAKEVRE